jgi:hypothetical protein
MSKPKPLVFDRPGQPADLVILIKDNDRDPLLGQLESCRQASRACADDDDWCFRRRITDTRTGRGNRQGQLTLQSLSHREGWNFPTV